MARISINQERPPSYNAYSPGLKKGLLITSPLPEVLPSFALHMVRSFDLCGKSRLQRHESHRSGVREVP
jgi:hypothetical protein